MKAGTILLAATVMLSWTPLAAAEVRDPVAPEQQQEPARNEVGIALLGVFGAGGRFEDDALNRYGPGFGVRGGVTLKGSNLYLGGSFVRFLGGEERAGRYYTSTLDAEFGYDFRLLHGLLVIRPELALGVAQPVTIQFDNRGYPLGFHWAPGLLVGLRLPPLLISAEIRRDVIPDWSNAVTFMLGGGVVF